MKLMTVANIAAPGNAVMYQVVRSVERPMPIMLPQEITLGSPRPRKDSDASVRMACAISTDVATTTGDKLLGNTCDRMMLRLGSPMVRAAVTYSALRTRSASARTNRVIWGHVVTPIAKMMLAMEGVNMTTRTMANKKLGKVWNISVIRMSTSSSHPRK